MSSPPDVDYSATSLRPGWETLPAALRDGIAVALGTEIAEVGRPVGSGFTGGFAAPVQLADGRRVFVKAAADRQHAYRAYQREAEIVPQLPAVIPIPGIVATTHVAVPDPAADAGANGPPAPGAAVPDVTGTSVPGVTGTSVPGAGGASVPGVGAAGAVDGGRRWFAVASTHVQGRMPGAPWTAEDFSRVSATCEVIADAMTPSPVPGLEPFAQDLLGDDSPLTVPRRILDGGRPVPKGFQPWLTTALPEIAELIELAPEAFAGETATHGDLRPDNLLIDPAGTCWTVDWNWLALGPRWMDWVGLLPYAQYQGIDTATAIRSNPLTADVPAEYLDSFVAAITAYFLDKLDEPPPYGCTMELRRHQRLMAWVFLDWLAARRGW